MKEKDKALGKTDNHSSFWFFFQTTRPYFGVTTIMTMTFDKVKKKSTALT